MSLPSCVLNAKVTLLSVQMVMLSTGRGLFSWIDGEDLQKLQLEEGDVYRIESGAVFYFLNNDDQTRKMHVFGIHDLAAAGASTRSGIRDGVRFCVFF